MFAVGRIVIVIVICKLVNMNSNWDERISAKFSWRVYICNIIIDNISNGQVMTDEWTFVYTSVVQCVLATWKKNVAGKPMDFELRMLTAFVVKIIFVYNWLPAGFIIFLYVVNFSIVIIPYRYVEKMSFEQEVNHLEGHAEEKYLVNKLFNR